MDILNMDTLVSINIPVFNRVDLLCRCISRIKEYTYYTPYEIVVINDGSTEEGISSLSQREVDIVVTHKENMGIAQSRHDGILASNGYYICEVDADIIVTPYWLGKLLTSLETMWAEHHQNVIVSALLSLQIGYFLGQKNSLSKFGFIEVDEVGTGCMVFRKSLIDIIGNFDPQLRNLWSDKDFCRRVKKYERKFVYPPHIVIDPKVIVYHHGWVDPQTGTWDITFADNTRSLPQLNDKKHKLWALHSMQLMKKRWNEVHSDMKQLKAELNR